MTGEFGKEENRKRTLWGKDEIAFVVQNYLFMTAREIGDVLGRSERAVNTMAYRIRTEKTVKKGEFHPVWSDIEKKKLVENINEHTKGELAVKLKRSKGAVEDKIRRFGSSKNLSDDCWQLEFKNPNNDASFALISMCIKEDFKQDINTLSRKLAKIKRIKISECRMRIEELYEKGLLGYFDKDYYFCRWKPADKK